MTSNFKFAALALLVGCATPNGWDDVPTAVVTPAAEPSQLTAWHAQAVALVDQWAALLAPLGCAAPFVVGDGGHVVRLVPRADWEYASRGDGWTDEDRIEIAGDVPPIPALLLHELGHALGLGHADPAFGPSLMTKQVGQGVFPRDIAAAACVMGCGPCDAADHYER